MIASLMSSFLLFMLEILALFELTLGNVSYFGFFFESKQSGQLKKNKDFGKAVLEFKYLFLISEKEQLNKGPVSLSTRN